MFSGVEYQVAAHLIYEGFVEEGLEIVRAVRARDDGYRRSPWNEAEAGFHYVRSMASWALMLAYSGFQYDARDDSIVFAPAAASEQFSCFFSAASSWGVFTQNSERAEIELKDGSLKLSRSSFRSQPAAHPRWFP